MNTGISGIAILKYDTTLRLIPVLKDGLRASCLSAERHQTLTNTHIKPAVANTAAQIKSRHSLHPLITPSALLLAAPTLLTPTQPCSDNRANEWPHDLDIHQWLADVQWGH